MVSEVRTVAADDLWMSTAVGRESVALHFTWQPDWAGVREVLPALEAALAPFEPRPHWGKLSTMAPEAIRASVPAAARLRGARRPLRPGRHVPERLPAPRRPRTMSDVADARLRRRSTPTATSAAGPAGRSGDSSISAFGADWRSGSRQTDWDHSLGGTHFVVDTRRGDRRRTPRWSNASIEIGGRPSGRATSRRSRSRPTGRVGDRVRADATRSTAWIERAVRAGRARHRAARLLRAARAGRPGRGRRSCGRRTDRGGRPTRRASSWSAGRRRRRRSTSTQPSAATGDRAMSGRRRHP